MLLCEPLAFLLRPASRAVAGPDSGADVRGGLAALVAALPGLRVRGVGPPAAGAAARLPPCADAAPPDLLALARVGLGALLPAALPPLRSLLARRSAGALRRLPVRAMLALVRLLLLRGARSEVLLPA